VALINLLLNGPLELVIPYILSITGEELTLSVMMSIMSGATFVGGLLVTIFGLPENKKRFIIAIMCLTGISMIGFGIAREGMWLGLFLVFCMMPLPALNAVFRTILQNHVPLELQGRALSIAYQIAYGLAPISFLVVGPVVDRILEPMMQEDGVAVLVSIFGNTAGAGLIIVMVTMVYSKMGRVSL